MIPPQSLVSSYLGMIIGSVVDVFERFVDQQSRGEALWLGLVQMLDTSFIVDEGGKLVRFTGRRTGLIGRLSFSLLARR